MPAGAITHTPSTPPGFVAEDLRVEQIPLELVYTGRNHRIRQPGDEERIASLMDSMREAGQLQPVRVYVRGEGQDEMPPPFRYILGFGARRCEAVRRMQKSGARVPGLQSGHVMAIVFPPAPDAQIEAARAIENLHRQDIGPMEEVLAVAQLLQAVERMPLVEQDRLGAMDDPHAYVASQLGQSVRWVRDRDYLHRLTPAVQELALQTDLPAGHLREIAKVGDPKLQLQIAVEATGGSPWCVGIDEDGRLAPAQGGYRTSYDEWLARAQEGSYHRLTLAQVEQRVAAAQRSLRQVPWVFEMPVVLPDGEEIRACQGCPHNSETDRTLFGIDEDEANPRGVCLSPGCYDRKVNATERAKINLLTAFRKRKKAPAAAEIDAKTPGWVKTTTARGYVQRELKKAAAPKAANSTAAATRSDGRVLTPLQAAIRSYELSTYKWTKKASEALEAAANATPERYTLVLLLIYTEAWHGLDPTDFGNTAEYGGTPRPPQPDKPLPTAVLTALEFVAGGQDHVWDLAGMPRSGFDEPAYQPFTDNLTATVALAKALGVELDPPPVYAPPAEKKAEAPKGKPVVKKKGSKKGGK